MEKVLFTKILQLKQKWYAMYIIAIWEIDDWSPDANVLHLKTLSHSSSSKVIKKNTKLSNLQLI